MLISEADDAQSVFFGTLDNAPPIDWDGHVGLSDLLKRRIQNSMAGTDLNVSLRVLVGAAVIDRNHITTPQVCRDFVDPAVRGFIENCFIKRPLDEHKVVTIETDEFLSSITDQLHRHSVQQFVGKMNARKWFQRVAPFNLIAK